jgi:YVTN family beta-propeller protein
MTVETRTLRELSTVAVGAPPHRQIVAASGVNQIWAFNSGDNTITQLDDTSGERVGSIQLDGSPRYSKVDWRSGTAYVVLDNEQVAILDARSGKLRGKLEFPSGSRPTSMIDMFHNDRLYVITYNGGTGVVDVRTNTLLKIIPPTGRGSTWGNPHGNQPCGKLYIINELSNDVSVIDETTEHVIATVPVGKGPERNCIDSLRRTVWVANAQDGTLTAIDIASDAVTDTIPVGDRPRWMYRMKKKTGSEDLWAMTRGSDDKPLGTIAVVDTTQRKVKDILPLCERPSHWLFEGPIVYVVSPTTREIHLYDARVPGIVGSPRLSRAPETDTSLPITFTESGHRMFLSNADDTVSVFEPTID